MILFPNAKINIGLKVLNKRSDGYHNIESVLYPIDLNDILEIQHASDFNISYSGIEFNREGEHLSEFISWLKLNDLIKPVSVHLHKIIPIESGLGGGSSDLAFFTNYILESLKDNNLKAGIKKKAMEFSTDSAYFMLNSPSFVEGKGEIVKSIDIDLNGYYLLLLFPEIKISTEEAYQNVSVNILQQGDWNALNKPVSHWKGNLPNSFEEFFSGQYQQYDALKSELYKSGAEFVSLSGSGSTVYAIYKKRMTVDLSSFSLKSKWVSL